MVIKQENSLSLISFTCFPVNRKASSLAENFVAIGAGLTGATRQAFIAASCIAAWSVSECWTHTCKTIFANLMNKSRTFQPYWLSILIKAVNLKQVVKAKTTSTIFYKSLPIFHIFRTACFSRENVLHTGQLFKINRVYAVFMKHIVTETQKKASIFKSTFILQSCLA